MRARDEVCCDEVYEKDARHDNNEAKIAREIMQNGESSRATLERSNLPIDETRRESPASLD